jgi:16S rRNA (guanine966-N2)-methyltransferase
MMKVTAGKYRGRNIESRPDKNLRPTSSRVREAIFNLLVHGKFMKQEDFVRDDNPSALEGRKAVDIFCGTGALGLEAMSRGVEHVTFVDQDSKILAITRRNVEHFGEQSHAQFIRSDSTRLPRAPMKHELAFVDPPYNKNLAPKALESLRDQGWLAHGAVVLVEHAKKEDLTVPEKFYLVDTREYNVTRISILQYRE